jgi:biopolymer transport protein ExbB/TolQ
MVYFFKSMGPFGPLLTIIALVIAVLIVRKIVDLWIRKDLSPHKLESGLHAILFWGAVSAVLGVLGQITGIYNALSVIVRATEISPNVVAQGFAESFTTTIFGIEILVISAIAWFILFCRYRKLIAS